MLSHNQEPDKEDEAEHAHPLLDPYEGRQHH